MSGNTNAGTNDFAMFPGMVMSEVDNALTFSKSENLKLYKQGMESLDFTFEGKADQLMLLKEHVYHKVVMMNWWNITEIPTSSDPNAPKLDLIMQHSQLTEKQIREWATANIVNKENRENQNNFMMFTCLMKSISEDVMKRMVPEKEKYVIGKLPIAALYYKLLINKAEVETRATVTNIRQRLSNLHKHIATVDYNITTFHEYVNQQLTSLSAYGLSDIGEALIVNLFQAYDEVPDEGFHRAIELKKTQYHMQMDEMEPKDLMSYAQKLYDYRLADANKPWKQKSQARIEIEALSAQLNNLKTENQKLRKNQNSKNQKNIDKLVDAAKKATVTNGSEKKSDGKKKKGEGAWAWKFTKPKDEDIEKPKEFRGKKWYWCKILEKYCTHHPKDCTVEKANANKKGDGGKKYNSAEKSATSYNATAQAALAMLAQASTAENE